MFKEEINKILAAKYGYGHLIGMSLEQAQEDLKDKIVDFLEWNPKEAYRLDWENNPNRITLIIRDNIVVDCKFYRDNGEEI